MTVPTGLTVTGSPVTTAGTFALSLTSGYSYLLLNRLGILHMVGVIHAGLYITVVQTTISLGQGLKKDCSHGH